MELWSFVDHKLRIYVQLTGWELLIVLMMILSLGDAVIGNNMVTWIVVNMEEMLTILLSIPEDTLDQDQDVGKPPYPQASDSLESIQGAIRVNAKVEPLLLLLELQPIHASRAAKLIYLLD